MNALKNPKLFDDLSLLFAAQDYPAIRTWFGYWLNQDELIDKVLLFGQFFLPDYFRDASPYFHRLLLANYFNNRNTYDAAPRGFSKTTLLQCAVLFECVNRTQKFIVFIEKTFTEAAEVLSAIRAECAENDLLKAVYGEMAKDEDAKKGSKSKDAEGDMFICGVRLRAKGFDQPVRGLKSRAYRPTKIILDDCEQDAHIRNPEQREKYEDNFNKGVQPAIDKDGTIKMYGTVLHEDSLLSNLIRLHGGRVFRAFYIEGEDDYEKAAPFTVVGEHLKRDPKDSGQTVRLLWPSRWDWATLMKKREEMRSKGLSTNAFEQEYRNKPIAEEERKFRWEWLHNPLRRIGLDDLLKSGRALVGYASIDAAESLRDGADSTASVVVLVDADGNWYLVDVRDDHRNVTDLVSLPFELWEKWKNHGLVKIGMEKKAFNDQMKPLLDEQKRLRQKFPVVEELKPMGRSKEGRILGALQGRFELGRVWVCCDVTGRPIGDTNRLLDQLYDFPSAAHDDMCLAGWTKVLTDRGEVPIQEVVVGDRVMTRFGFRRVLKSVKTGEKPVVENLGIVGTWNHPVVTTAGTKPLAHVLPSDTLYSWNARLSRIEEKNITAIRNPRTDSCGSISGGMTGSRGLRSRSIARFIWTLSERFRRVLSSITRTAIRSTTGRTTFPASAKDSTSSNTSRSLPVLLSQVSQSPLRKEPQENGAAPQPDEVFTSGSGNCLGRASAKSGRPAKSAARVFGAGSLAAVFAGGIVRCAHGTIVGVYNLHVEGHNEFFANGILVHNSDALAYVSDIAVTPMKDERQQQTHRTPSDDPWEGDRMDIPSIESGGVIHGNPQVAQDDPFE